MFPKYHQESEGPFFSANESPKRLYVGCLPAQLMNASEYLSLKMEATLLCLFPSQILSIFLEHSVMRCQEHNPVSKLFLLKNQYSCLSVFQAAHWLVPWVVNNSLSHFRQRELLTWASPGRRSIGGGQAVWSVEMDITDKFSSTLNPSWISFLLSVNAKAFWVSPRP